MIEGDAGTRRNGDLVSQASGFYSALSTLLYLYFFKSTTAAIVGFNFGKKFHIHELK
ncbi:hypothetical protein I8752_09740 [Nostocaceae cyanobacterium CENA369]|uniref:Uncharacterized protein n=1 Tax=Dendronalium phyllosphericum CENA369 TaxID=1725256 RepID=A0A8J7LEZ8_9NOST|nr:hypothetical protein [Dendronalium phyllosphericum]MBH8573289.1 hypothetical protein [Dendronalium phyllosphericum CENA369]